VTGHDAQCSFCEKHSAKVRLMISSPQRSAYICNECVGVCVSIIRENRAEQSGPKQGLEVTHRRSTSWLEQLFGLSNPKSPID